MIRYAEAEQYLLSLVNYEKLPPPARGDEQGWHLKEFDRFLERLGRPEKACPLLHVAGTKGKGSSTRLAAGLLQAAGYQRVGAFTSPHIEHFRERISIDGAPISERDFCAALRQVRPLIDATTREGFRTTFEVLTAIAYVHFQKARCEAAVIETGLGGRLDCTNVALARVALITAIGFDHQRVLGDTLREIAREKAGIAKRGTTRVVVGPQMPRRRGIVRRAVEDQALRAGGLAVDFCDTLPDPLLRIQPKPWGYEFDIRTEADEAAAPAHFKALGRHQVDNLRAALAAVGAFCRADGRSLPATGAAAAVREYRTPGRLEVLREEPPVLVDAAHCPLSMRAAVRALDEHFPGRPLAVVFGVLGDKNLRPMLEVLVRSERVREFVTYAPQTPRACPVERVIAEADRAGIGAVSRAAAPGEALDQALACQRGDNRLLVLATGTTYGVADMRRAFERAGFGGPNERERSGHSGGAD